jgi:TrmH family RNA methyltransferase
LEGLSKQKQKYIQSLHLKKYRQQFGVFIVEGQKSIEELVKSDFEILELYLTDKAKDLKVIGVQIKFCSEQEIKKITSFKSNNFGVAVVAIKANEPIKANSNEWILALDDINDPGNLGTIIRLADWYGISKIICSENTVEFYNPKVISSSMGSFTRVQSFYTDLEGYFSSNNSAIYGAFLDGKNIHQEKLPKGGTLLMGSESHGISDSLEKVVQHKITIPSFGQAESLNVGVATAIILDNIRRT